MALNLADTDGDIRNNDLIIELFDETEEVNGQSIKPHASKFSTLGVGKCWHLVIWRTSPPQITGAAEDDSFRIESSTLDQSAALHVILDGGEGVNNVVFDTSRDTNWTIDGDNQGTASDGVIQVTFTDIQDLTGAADNNDTFVLNEEGTLEGVLDGGHAGYDTLVSNKASTDVTYTPTGPTSGLLNFDSTVLSFDGLEPSAVDLLCINRVG